MWPDWKLLFRACQEFFFKGLFPYSGHFRGWAGTKPPLFISKQLQISGHQEQNCPVNMPPKLHLGENLDTFSMNFLPSSSLEPKSHSLKYTCFSSEKKWGRSIWKLGRLKKKSKNSSVFSTNMSCYKISAGMSMCVYMYMLWMCDTLYLWLLLPKIILQKSCI